MALEKQAGAWRSNNGESPEATISGTPRTARSVARKREFLATSSSTLTLFSLYTTASVVVFVFLLSVCNASSGMRVGVVANSIVINLVSHTPYIFNHLFDPKLESMSPRFDALLPLHFIIGLSFYSLFFA